MIATQENCTPGILATFSATFISGMIQFPRVADLWWRLQNWVIDILLTKASESSWKFQVHAICLCCDQKFLNFKNYPIQKLVCFVGYLMISKSINTTFKNKRKQKQTKQKQRTNNQKIGQIIWETFEKIY